MNSKKPKKQRKAFYGMPLHRKQKAVSAHLSKRLREELGVRALPVRKGDTVKVLRGKFKGKSGKVSSIKVSKMQVFIEKITRKKADGTEAIVPLKASNLLIESLEKSDEKRFKRIKKQNPTSKTTKGKAGKTENAKEQATQRTPVKEDSAGTISQPKAEMKHEKQAKKEKEGK